MNIKYSVQVSYKKSATESSTKTYGGINGPGPSQAFGQDFADKVNNIFNAMFALNTYGSNYNTLIAKAII